MDYTPENRDCSPLDSPVFPLLFGTKGAEPFVLDLINALFETVGLEPLSQIDSLDAEHTTDASIVGCKTPRMDLVVMAPNRVIDIETQHRATLINERTFCYSNFLFTNHISKGTDYNNLPQIVVVMLDDYKIHFPDDPSFVHYTINRWQNGALYSDRTVTILVELKKFTKQHPLLDENILKDKLRSWLYYLTKGYSDEKECEMLNSCFPGFDEFSERYKGVIADEDMWLQYYFKLTSEMDYNSEMNAARKEGRAEGEALGRAEGEALGRTQIIAQLKEMGVDQSVIDKLSANKAPCNC